VRLGRPGADSTQRRRAGRAARAAAVAVVTVAATVLVTGGTAESAGRHAGRENDRERSTRRFRDEQGTETGRPAEFVAERNGRIVVVSSETGRIERYLTAVQPGGGAKEPALSPNGRTVWFSRGDGTCAAHLASMALAGGKEEKLPGSGEAGPEGTPLPRPGRPHIAYSRTDCKEPTAALIVGDLGGLEGHGQLGLVPLAWSRDGRLLLAATVDGDEVRLLQVSDSGAIVGNEPLDVADSTQGCRLKVMGFSPDDNDGYVALRRCGAGESARRSLVLLGRDGDYRRTVVRLRRGEDFLGRPAFDPTGHSLLYSTVPARVDRGSAGGPEVNLWLWHDGETRILDRQSGYRHPSWLP